MLSIFGVAAHVADRRGRGLGGFRGGVDMGFGERAVHEGRGMLSTRSGLGATAASATRAETHFFFAASSSTDTPAPTTAMSISLRGIKRKYAAPEFGFGGGILRVTSISPRCRQFFPGATQNCSTGTLRVPCGPAMTQIVRKAIRAGIESPAGEALHKLPPKLARL